MMQADDGGLRLLGFLLIDWDSDCAFLDGKNMLQLLQEIR